MNILLKFLRSNTKKILSVVVFVSVASILFLVYAFLENLFEVKAIIVSLFSIAIFLILILQYFLKNQLKNDVTRLNLNNRVVDLKFALKKAEKLAEQKSVYLANMSYEVRTPLNTVIGMLNMLKQTELDEDQSAQVEIATYSSMHLLQLVNMVTDNSEVDAGDFKLNMQTIDLETDLGRLFKVLEYQAWEKGLEFEFKFLAEEKDKFLVIGDTARIQQVLINLINNAIKFTNSGKISIIVDQSIGIDNEQIITFYVKDTGVGMKQAEVQSIFADTDKGLENSITRDYRGGGMGLSISHKLVGLMGGELKLETKENEGSTFYFSLQLKKTLSLKTAEQEFNPILKEKFNVLVAEDNRMNQKVIKFLLEREGADCTFVKNGLEALELYKILDFDMVFMDIYMPDMDGYEATKSIKRTQKYLSHKIPVIGVSASAFEEDLEHAKSSGIDEFLSKPIEVEKLKDLLVKYSKNKTMAE
ncbi:response regulator [Seonamhaeicola sp. ML3]|uniref:response regulator n=1 Tax=Seonamhaeicola sp. ML3 TaxID=2937786 RepID=UPI00200CC98C|nr:response regulator [Seonamhaeicola sp. ML3]